MLQASLGLLALVSGISAAPATSQNPVRDLAASVPAARDLHKRDSCNQDGATYQLYKDYDQNDCPAPNPSNYGDCFPLGHLNEPFGAPCNIFCQQHVEFTYGQEQILPLSICHHPFTCTVTETITKTIQHGWTFNLGGGFTSEAKVAFSAGASYTYTWNTANTNTQSLAVTPKEKECGYFAFLPHLVTTCGLLADAPADSSDICPQPKQHYNRVTEGCESDFVTIKSASGEDRHEGATVFVYVDCGTNAPLPCGDGTVQDEAYCKDGVALPRDVAVSALSAFPTFTGASNDSAATITATFADPSPTASLTYGPADYAITSDPVPEVTPSADGGTSPTAVTTSADATSTSADPTSTSAAPSPTATGTCKAGTLSSGSCDSLCAGGTCTTGSTALGQQVTTCSDCPE